MSIKGKVALVTGASRGIGRAIATRLANEGAHVIGTATSEQGARAINDYLQAIHPDSAGCVLNVTEHAQLAEFVKQLHAKHGPVEILVNNAGITRDNILLRMKSHEWEEIIATNLSAVFYLTQACLRGMVKQKFGRVVTIGSVVGDSGGVGQANYAATKAGIIGFTKSLAQELASRNLTANVVSPGFIKSDMTDVLPDAHKEAILNMIPMRRQGAAEDVAAAVNFLVSEEASYITGQTLHVNGGMLM